MIKTVLLTQIFALIFSIIASLTQTTQRFKIYIVSLTSLSAIFSITALVSYIMIPKKSFIYLFRFIFIERAHFAIGILSDALSITCTYIASIILALTVFYSLGYIKRKLDLFLINIHLLTISFILFITANNLMQMYLFSTLMIISSYFLISFEGKENQTKAAFKMLSANLVADGILLFGLIILFYIFGTLNFEKINTLYVVNKISVGVLEGISIIFFIPILIKLSQCFKIWLSSVSSQTSIPTSAMLHSCTLATSSIFIIIRLQSIFECSEKIQNLLIITGLLSSLIFGILSIFSSDIRKILSYSVSASIGLMITACGFSAYGSTIIIYVTQAFSKALLFFAAGSVIHALSGEQNINKMGGLFTLLPKTYLVFILATSTLISIPLLPAYYTGKVLFNEIVNSELSLTYIATVFIMLNFILTACSLFRLIYKIFHTETKLDETCLAYVNESDNFIIMSMYGAVFLALFSGIAFYYAVYTDEVWKDIFPYSDRHESLVTLTFTIISGIGTIFAVFLSKFIRSYDVSKIFYIDFKNPATKFYTEIITMARKYIYFTMFKFMNNSNLNIINAKGAVQYILSLIFVACCYAIFVLK